MYHEKLESDANAKAEHDKQQREKAASRTKAGREKTLQKQKSK
jgi:hypothetical protein